MSREKLTESLLDKRDAKARAIWVNAEQRLRQHRQRTEERCAEQRRETEAHLQAELSRRLDRLQTRIDRRKRQLRLRSEEAFAQRLRRLADAQLASLSDERRSETLRRLARELPDRDWRRITVHPDDQQLARQLFPQADIDTDPQLGGGLLAATEDDSVRVDNSLAGRLEQMWPQLSGRLLDSLRADRGET